MLSPAVILALLSSLSGCSLVIDSGQYVPQHDAGPRDTGTDGNTEQGPDLCSGVSCDSGEVCVAGFCVQCAIDQDCEYGLCDPVAHTCVDPVGDCASCDGDTLCVDHPSGGGIACVRCDRDHDGFVIDWRVCDFLAEGRPRDCDDFDPERYPGAVPRCADSLVQGCPSELDSLVHFLPGGAAIGRIPPVIVSSGLTDPPQFSVLAVDPDETYGDDLSAARWLYGHSTSYGEALLTTMQYRRYDSASHSPEWSVGGDLLRNRSGWPFVENGVSSFVMSTFEGEQRFGINGLVDGSPMTFLLGDRGSGLVAYASEDSSNDFLPPLAIIGGSGPELVFRDAHPVTPGVSRLRSLQNQTDTGLALISSDPTWLLSSVGDYAFFHSSFIDTQVWDGVASMPASAATPIFEDTLSGSPRFTWDPITGDIIGLLPYHTGVRVVRFVCSAPGLANCSHVTSPMQPFLHGLVHFDIEVFSGVMLVVAPPNGIPDHFIEGHVFTISNTLTLNRVTAQPIPLMSESEIGLSVASVLGVQTDLHFGPDHVEFVVGVPVHTALQQDVLMVGSGIRVCFAL